MVSVNLGYNVVEKWECEIQLKLFAPHVGVAKVPLSI